MRRALPVLAVLLYAWPALGAVTLDATACPSDACPYKVATGTTITLDSTFSTAGPSCVCVGVAGKTGWQDGRNVTGITVTGVSFTKRAEYRNVSGGGYGVTEWWCGSAAQLTDVGASVTLSNSYETFIVVVPVVGSSCEVGATGTGLSSGGQPSVTVNATVAGSMILGVAADLSQNNTPSQRAGTTLIQRGPGTSANYPSWRSTNATSGPGNVTIGDTGSFYDAFLSLGIEVKELAVNPVAGSVQASATATSGLTTGIALSGSLSATATALGTFAAKFVGSVQGGATATGDLSTGVSLAASLEAGAAAGGRVWIPADSPHSWHTTRWGTILGGFWDVPGGHPETYVVVTVNEPGTELDFWFGEVGEEPTLVSLPYAGSVHQTYGSVVVDTLESANRIHLLLTNDGSQPAIVQYLRILIQRDANGIITGFAKDTSIGGGDGQFSIPSTGDFTYFTRWTEVTDRDGNHRLMGVVSQDLPGRPSSSDIKVRAETTGALGTATVRYSLDNGATWSATLTPPTPSGDPLKSKFLVPWFTGQALIQGGISVNFIPAGSGTDLVAGDEWTIATDGTVTSSIPGGSTATAEIANGRSCLRAFVTSTTAGVEPSQASDFAGIDGSANGTTIFCWANSGPATGYGGPLNGAYGSGPAPAQKLDDGNIYVFHGVGLHSSETPYHEWIRLPVTSDTTWGHDDPVELGATAGTSSIFAYPHSSGAIYWVWDDGVNTRISRVNPDNTINLNPLPAISPAWPTHVNPGAKQLAILGDTLIGVWHNDGSQARIYKATGISHTAEQSGTWEAPTIVADPNPTSIPLISHGITGLGMDAGARYWTVNAFAYYHDYSSATWVMFAAFPAVAQIAAASIGATVAAGELTTSIRLADGAVGSAAASASLTTGIPLAGSGSGGASAAGALSTAIPLAGASTGAASAAAVVSTSIRLGSAASAGATVAAELTAIPAGLGGAAAGGASVSGALTVPIILQGSVTATGTASGSLAAGPPQALESAAAGTAAAAGELIASVRLGFAGAGGAAATATLTTGLRLSGAAQGSAVVSGHIGIDLVPTHPAVILLLPNRSATLVLPDRSTVMGLPDRTVILRRSP